MKQGAHGDGRVRMRAARANARETGSRTRNRALHGTGPCAKRQSRPPLLARLRGVARGAGSRTRNRTLRETGGGRRVRSRERVKGLCKCAQNG